MEEETERKRVLIGVAHEEDTAGRKKWDWIWCDTESRERKRERERERERGGKEAERTCGW